MTRAVIFGDGLAADPAAGALGFARVLPLLLGWRGQVLGRPGPGFVKLPMDERRPYASRLPELRASGCDVVLVQVSGNDARVDPDAVREAGDAFLAAAQAAVPVVHVLGPVWSPYAPRRLPVLRDLVARVCADRGLLFVDGLGWLSPSLVAPDGEHPTRRGHLRIAARTAQALRTGRPGPA